MRHLLLVLLNVITANLKIRVNDILYLLHLLWMNILLVGRCLVHRNVRMLLKNRRCQSILRKTLNFINVWSTAYFPKVVLVHDLRWHLLINSIDRKALSNLLRNNVVLVAAHLHP